MQSPYFLLYQLIPDYKFLKAFECAYHPHLIPYSPYKFNFHSQECIYLGYSSSHKGYKCLASNGRLYISKDVIFNESNFPFPHLFPTELPTSPQNTTVSSPFPLLPTISHPPLSFSPSPSSNTPPINTSSTSTASTSDHSQSSPLFPSTSPISTQLLVSHLTNLSLLPLTLCLHYLSL